MNLNDSGKSGEQIPAKERTRTYTAISHLDSPLLLEV